MYIYKCIYIYKYIHVHETYRTCMDRYTDINQYTYVYIYISIYLSTYLPSHLSIHLSTDGPNCNPSPDRSETPMSSISCMQG